MVIPRLLAALASAAVLTLAVPSPASASATRWVHSDVTAYGYPDNSPPGAGISYPRLHRTAGGTGTWANPVTFATDPREIAPGTRIYMRYLHKYFVMEDECAACDSDWGHGWWHVDLWIGSSPGNYRADSRQEDFLTQLPPAYWQWVIINPPSNWWVDPRPLMQYTIGEPQRVSQ